MLIRIKNKFILVLQMLCFINDKSNDLYGEQFENSNWMLPYNILEILRQFIAHNGH